MFVNLFLKTLNISVVIYDNKSVGSRPYVCYVASLRTQGYRSIIRAPTLEWASHDTSRFALLLLEMWLQQVLKGVSISNYHILLLIQ